MAKKTADTPKDDAADSEIDFESALAELEGLVTQMESGDLSLDQSLKAFERGVSLTRQCQTALKNAELKVQTLTDEGELVDLDTDALDDG
jgi:exodeoxyribonuclease VII small subunit